MFELVKLRSFAAPFALVLSLGFALTTPAFAQEGSEASGEAELSTESAALGSSVSSHSIGSQKIWIGVERITGIFLESVTTSYEPPGTTGTTQTDTMSFTTVAILGNTAATASSLPRLALDYFISPNISVGGSFVFTTASLSSDSETDINGAVNETESDIGSSSAFVLAPRVGYALGLSDSFGLWARGGITLVRTGTSVVTLQDMGETQTADTSSLLFDLTLEPMFFFRVNKHFLLEGGPFLDFGLFGNRNTTSGPMEDDRSARLTSYGLTFGLAVAP
jgi:hypothetical protein